MPLIVSFLAVFFNYPITKDRYTWTLKSINNFLEKYVLSPKASFYKRQKRLLLLLRIAFTKQIISDGKYVPIITKL